MIITGNDGRVIADLTALSAQIQRPQRLLKVLAYQLVVDLKSHFLMRNAEANKHGWPSKNFWKKEGVEGANKTAISSLTDTEAVVSVASPAIAFKTHGGTILPKRGKYLAIPASAQAYAAGSPRELDENFLQFIPIRRGGKLGGILVTRAHTKLVYARSGNIKKGANVKAGTLWYYLVKSTDHQADPRALPPDSDINDSLYNTATEEVARQIAEQTGT
jgi:hypothetical protein